METTTESREHMQILNELRNIRKDFQDMMKVTREETGEYRNEMRDEMKEIKAKLDNQQSEMSQIQTNLAVVTAQANDARSLIWKVGGVALLVSATAIAKALGFY